MAKDERKSQPLCCSFCGKSQKEVKKLIAGPTVYICNECIDLCNLIIATDAAPSEASPILPAGAGVHDGR